jgi:fluoride exporter
MRGHRLMAVAAQRLALSESLAGRRMALQRYLLIALGGGLGSIARYWVGSTIGGRMGMRFPFGTLVVNVSACLIIGFFLTWLSLRAEVNPVWRYLVAVGFIGAYSTFSTYEWETLSTLRSGAFALASAYAAGSVALGLAATWCGAALAEAL